MRDLRRPLVTVALTLMPLSSAFAVDCGWLVTPQISPTDDSGSVYTQIDDNEYWAYHHILDHHMMWGYIDGETDNATFSDAGSGNGTFTVQRNLACPSPDEDIEADARNEFKARAELDDDDNARSMGMMRITANKVNSRTGSGKLTCLSQGGAMAADSAPSGEEGSGGVQTISFEAFGVGAQVPVQWSTGGSVEKVYSGADGGAGGKSIEVFNLHTQLETQIILGGTWAWSEWAFAEIKESKSQLRVWGTCDGGCQVVRLILNDQWGY